MYRKDRKTNASPIMWHRYVKRTIGWLCPSSSRCKEPEVRGQLQREWGRTLGTICTCEEIERGTHAFRASKLGPVERWWTQDGKLGITIQDPPPESGRRTHLLYFTYSYCILSRVWQLAISLHIKSIITPKTASQSSRTWRIFFLECRFSFSRKHDNTKKCQKSFWLATNVTFFRSSWLIV